MEKLINLANQYVEELWMSTKRIKDERWIICGEWEWTNISEIVLISKNYWFIQRLVENEKIDLPAFQVYKLDLRAMEHKYIEYSTYEQILMLLSIQDEPISFLISILK